MLDITWNKNDNLALAVSTGIDSMSLLHMLNTTYKHTYHNLICFHVNHGLREASKEEAAFIERFCKERDIEIYIKTLDLSEVVNREKSIQDVSRKMRYEWFDEMMKQTQSDVLLTAHHLDDQKETITYRLFTGRIGRASLGIEQVQERKDYIICRPFLNLPKSSLVKYHEEFAFRYFEDDSNKDTKYTRNYIRNKILPVIQQREELSTDHLLDLNQWMNDARSLIVEQAKLFISTEVQQLNKVVINRNAFNRLNHLVKIEVLDQLLESYIQQRFSVKAYKEWIGIFENFEKQSIFHISDDWQFIVAYDKLLLCEDIEFNVNSKFINRNEQYVFGNWLIEANDIASPLFIRKRLSGDRVQYYNRGNKHHKKVNRIMIDHKIDIHKRNNCPIILYGDDIIAIGDFWMDSNFKNALTITYIGDDFNE
ncbi:tRNA lysidine(34) synthetase TilS [Mammaliicoccus fleurettii]|uniref:tRNA lysidine(34) synthetase TilS n=1 Tax=Mammaliicoccus fleurettii TaxID=150056 RepID=UPI000E084A84|nr:tRNA lysidine(34) synthetase TilS [Mammaliicoccus fleurettii]MEB6202123.1 tRNA lysidine(34) synthetase TilS [Mammaliicoccus fleurettii]RTX91133.1 tRNA lysidine(34) synthetase TilS [Mammaliicoccus fleurettii]SUM37761.1 tRNA(Ile)-lysidine synthetase [Mammaliicoccus fleurettii]HCN61576.1 tRNA lysidine(34) synthetase TilS [Staphylococcus sp.]